jgi:hypothetical protein
MVAVASAGAAAALDAGQAGRAVRMIGAVVAQVGVHAHVADALHEAAAVRFLGAGRGDLDTADVGRQAVVVGPAAHRVGAAVVDVALAVDTERKTSCGVWTLTAAT